MTTGAPEDLLVLDANPVSDFANAARHAGVIVRGHWLTKAEALGL